ncbi:hypothetical protein [Candidatus Poriferisodalis sp.]|uniref:hypothetical protein n=1 Tax=Candidatus Poriferisodalis sp. TaxID=3101277 RepID=UPI003B02B550
MTGPKTGAVVIASQAAITPAATAQEAAAIVAALEMVWPRPVEAPPAPPPSKWRFSGRPWHAPRSWPAVRYR